MQGMQETLAGAAGFAPVLVEDTMKIGFVVNQIETEQATFTTTRLAMAAVNRGHESWLIGTGDLALDPDDYVRARAGRPQSRNTSRSICFWKNFAIRLHGLSGSPSMISTC